LNFWQTKNGKMVLYAKNVGILHLQKGKHRFREGVPNAKKMNPQQHILRFTVVMCLSENHLCLPGEFVVRLIYQRISCQMNSVAGK